MQFRTHGDWLLKVLNLLTGNFNLAGLAHMLTIWISWLHFSLMSAFCIVLLWQQLQQELQENPGSHPFDEVHFFVSFLIILNRWPMHYCRVQREREGVSYLSIYVLLMHFGITVMGLYNEWSPTRMCMKPNENWKHYQWANINNPYFVQGRMRERDKRTENFLLLSQPLVFEDLPSLGLMLV